MDPIFIPLLIFFILALALALLVRKAKHSKRPDGFDDWRVQECWEDYPTVNYDKSHTYCSVVFEDTGKTFYYRTRNPELKVGDLVYVPVGYQYEKQIGRIVKMKKYPGYLVPYPLEKTKHIIGKVM